MFSIIWKNITGLMHNKLKFFLTVGGIAIGVMSVIIIYSSGETGKKEIDKMLGGMGMDCIVVSADIDENNGLNEDDLYNIRKIDNVENAMPLMNMMTYCNKEDVYERTECMLWGVNEDADNVIDLDVKYGRLINSGDIAEKSDVCIIDSELALELFEREDITGNMIGVAINGHTVYYTVAGIVDSGVSMLQSMFGGVIPSFIYIPYTSMQKYSSQYCFNQIAVRADDDVEDELEHTVLLEHDSKANIEVSSFLSQKDTLSDIVSIISVILSAIAGISLIVSGFSVMNIMLVSVNERIKEIGIKKSLGAKNSDIVLEFLSESAVITLTGGIIGTVFGILIIVLFGIFTGYNVSINFNFMFFTLLFSAVSGIIFGVYPAYKAGKMNPVDALRG